MHSRVRLYLSILATVALVAQVAPLPNAQANGEAHLAQNVTSSSPANGESVSLDSVDGFNPAGGEAIFDPGNSFAETFSYGGIDTDNATLLGLDRPDPRDHPSGAVVQPRDGSASPPPPDSPQPSPADSAAPPDGVPPDGSDGSPSGTDQSGQSDGPEESASGVATPCPASLREVCELAEDPVPPINCGNPVDTVCELIPALLECIPATPSSAESSAVEVTACEDVEQLLNELQRIISDVCGNGVKDCPDYALGIINDLLVDIDRLIADTCNGVHVGSSSSAAGVAVTDPCVALAVRAVNAIMGLACQSDLGDPMGCVNRLIDKVNDLVANACNYRLDVTSATSEQGVAECVSSAMDWVNYVMYTACRSTDASQCANNLLDQVNDLVANACNYRLDVTSATGEQGVTECVSAARDWVNYVMYTACQSTDASQCANNLFDKANDLLVHACAGQVSPDPTSGTGSTECINFVLRTFFDGMYLLCRSYDAQVCASNLIAQVDASLTAWCGLVPVASGGATTGVPQGVSTCVAKALGVVNLVMTTACQTTNAQTCVTNTINKINGILASWCGLVPVPSTGWTTGGIPPGVAFCVDKGLGVFTLIMTTACQSTNAQTCVTNTINRVDGFLTAWCGLVPVASGGATTGVPQGVSTCVAKALGVVNLVMTTACQTTNAVQCVNRLAGTLDGFVMSACGLIAGEGGATIGALPPGTATCVSKALGVVSLGITSTCDSSNGEECANNLIETMEYLVIRGCQPILSSPTSTSGLQACSDRVVAMLATVVATCQSGNPEECALSALRSLSACAAADPLGLTRTFDRCAEGVLQTLSKDASVACDVATNTARGTYLLCSPLAADGDPLPQKDPQPVGPDGAAVLAAARTCQDGFTPDGIQLCVVQPLDLTQFALTGRVMNKSSLVPIPNAHITLTTSTGLNVSTVSDVAGQFAFANLPAQLGSIVTGTIRVTAPGYGLYQTSNHKYEAGEGYGVSVMMGSQNHVETLESGQMGSGPGAPTAPDNDNEKFDHARVPAIAKVDVYRSCELNSPTYDRTEKFPWKFYVLHVVGPEVGGEFDEIDDFDQKVQYLRANVSAISNFAWSIKLAQNRALDGRVNDQCFDPDYDAKSWWPEKATVPLGHRIVKDGLVQRTEYKAGEDHGCDPPYKPDDYELEQNDATSCADEGKDWGSPGIIKAFYGPNEWSLDTGRAPDFDGKSANSAGGGKVRIDWQGTGVWRSVLYQNTQPDPDLQPRWSEIWRGGFEKSCHCIKKSFTHENLISGQTYEYKIDLFNPAGGRTGYVEGRAG